MISFIWSGMIFLSFFYSLFSGGLDALSASVIASAEKAVSVLLFMTAVIPFWNGIMNIASAAGITSFIAKFLRPILKRMFPRSFKNENCAEAISMNVAANMIGIGNAATPFGLKAVSEMKKLIDSPEANSEMIKFIVLNTASIQLIPTTVAAMRQRAGAAAPYDIILPVLICTVAGLAAGLISASLFRRLSEKRRLVACHI